jgi:hypothetical protein
VGDRRSRSPCRLEQKKRLHFSRTKKRRTEAGKQKAERGTRRTRNRSLRGGNGNCLKTMNLMKIHGTFQMRRNVPWLLVRPSCPGMCMTVLFVTGICGVLRGLRRKFGFSVFSLYGSSSLTRQRLDLRTATKMRRNLRDLGC